MNAQVDRRLTDEALAAYVDWREECAEVRNAYERWLRTDTVDAADAFAAYRAALDLEECASRAYADLVGTVGGENPIEDLAGLAVDPEWILLR